MIEANVLKGLHEILGDGAVDPKQEETIGQYVARALHISEHQAEVLLAALERGSTVAEAVVEAQVDTAIADSELLTKIARAIGTALGNGFFEISLRGNSRAIEWHVSSR